MKKKKKKEQFNCYKNTRKEGLTKSFVHGKKKEIVCHDMRKYVWQQNEKIGEKNNKKKRP